MKEDREGDVLQLNGNVEGKKGKEVGRLEEREGGRGG
jgi:hypothetical protein